MTSQKGPARVRVRWQRENRPMVTRWVERSKHGLPYELAGDEKGGGHLFEGEELEQLLALRGSEAIRG